MFRSGGSDQIFASIVSVLLALMDGLTDRGQVLVIGATNRCSDAATAAVYRDAGDERYS
jgi:SpoVK/Ycf46/Vps4 family AAA+-type ATPase